MLLMTLLTTSPSPSQQCFPCTTSAASSPATSRARIWQSTVSSSLRTSTSIGHDYTLLSTRETASGADISWSGSCRSSLVVSLSKD